MCVYKAVAVSVARGGEGKVGLGTLEGRLKGVP